MASKCIVCQIRPPRAGTRLCWQCTEAARDLSPQERYRAWGGTQAVLTWKGSWIKLVATREQNEEGATYLRTIYLGHEKPKGIPKGTLVLNLDKWQGGYSKDQIKKFKDAFRRMAPKVKHIYQDGSHRMVPML